MNFPNVALEKEGNICENWTRLAQRVFHAKKVIMKLFCALCVCFNAYFNHKFSIKWNCFETWIYTFNYGSCASVVVKNLRFFSCLWSTGLRIFDMAFGPRYLSEANHKKYTIQADSPKNIENIVQIIWMVSPNNGNTPKYF